MEGGGDHVRVKAIRFPLDFSFAVESVFDRVRPNAVALVELETWPNFLGIAESRRIPVGLINGRVSEKSFPRYRAVRPLMKGMLGRLTFLGVQTEAIAERFRALGAPAERVEVLPTLKYDNADFREFLPGQEMLGRAMGLDEKHWLLVAGSTGPGEEGAVLDAYMALRGEYPGLRLAIAPRKPESVGGVVAAIRARELRAILRTERPDDPEASDLKFQISNFKLQNSAFSLQASEVFVLDTLGELKKLYALASGVFVGRSLVRLGGSDMIEAAALGKPVCFGPFTSNFAEVVDLLLAEKTAVEVGNGEDLMLTVESWLREPVAAAAMGRRAQEVIKLQRGSTERYVVKLLELIHGRAISGGAN